MNKKLILASSSPRRQQLLKQVKIPYTVRTADVNESTITTSDPYKKVTELAKLKGRSLPLGSDREVILSADTLIALDEEILEKPKTKEEAYDMISSLSGKIHEVLTGVTLRSKNKERTFVECTKVEFWPLSEEDIRAYINTDEPYDKAGAYGIQSLGAIFVKQLIGDYYNVMGLPLSKVVRELKDFHITSLFTE